MKRVADVNLNWSQLTYIRVCEPSPGGDGGPDGGQRLSRRRQRAVLGNVQVYFTEPTPVTQVRYFEDSSKHNSIQLNAKSVDLIDDRIYDNEKERDMPDAGATED